MTMKGKFVSKLGFLFRSILVYFGVRNWCITDLLKGEKFPQRKGEWGIIYPISSIILSGGIHCTRAMIIKSHFHFIFKQWAKGELIERLLLTDEDYESLVIKLRKNQKIFYDTKDFL